MFVRLVGEVGGKPFIGVQVLVAECTVEKLPSAKSWDRSSTKSVPKVCSLNFPSENNNSYLQKTYFAKRKNLIGKYTF